MGHDIPFATQMLGKIVLIPGHIDDVARRAIALAKLYCRMYGKNCTVKCRYCGVTLYVRECHTVPQVRTYFDTIQTQRLWSHRAYPGQ